MKRIYVLSTLALLTVSLFTQPATISQRTKTNGFDEVALDFHNETALNLGNKRVVLGEDETVDVSPTFVQYGTTTVEGEEVYVIRYATAVKGDIKSISYQRGSVVGKEDVPSKEVTTLYRGISAGDEVYYYDAANGGVSTDESLKDDYYWACYTIRYLTPDFYNVQIPVSLSVNGEAKSYKSISLDELRYEATETEYKMKRVFGSGYCTYDGNIGTIYSAQTTVVDQNGDNVEFAYVDYSVDMIIDNDTAGNNNFGLVFNKTPNAEGHGEKCYQFNFLVGETDNIQLNRNNALVAGTKTSYKIEVGKKYNFRAVTSPNGNKVNVKCYIDNEEVINVDVDPTGGDKNQCGLRMGATVTNRFANVKLLDKTPEVDDSVTLTLNHSSYTLNALESFTLIPTLSQEQVFPYVWESSDETVAVVKDGKVTAVGSGEADITVSTGSVSATCKVTVNAEENYYFKSVYGTGVSKTTNVKGVYTFGASGVQSDLVNADGSDCALTNYEIELNLVMGCNVGTGGNLGFQINKVKNSDNGVKQAYMLKPMTSASVATDNVTLVKNGSSTVSKATYTLEKGVVYRVKIIVATLESSVNVKAYIDGNEVCDYTDTSTTLVKGTIFGLRCGSLMDNNSPHKVSIVSLTKK